MFGSLFKKAKPLNDKARLGLAEGTASATILIALFVPVAAHAQVFGCTPTSIVAFRDGGPQIEQQKGDPFTFNTVTGVQSYLLEDTPAARFATPKGRAYAMRIEAVKNNSARSKAIIDEMMADKSIAPPVLEFKFDILSSQSSLSLSAAARSCLPPPGEYLCVGRFLTIRLPGEVTLQGKALNSPVPAGTFILVEGNMLTVTSGTCRII